MTIILFITVHYNNTEVIKTTVMNLNALKSYDMNAKCKKKKT